MGMEGLGGTSSFDRVRARARGAIHPTGRGMEWYDRGTTKGLAGGTKGKIVTTSFLYRRCYTSSGSLGCLPCVHPSHERAGL